MLQEPQPEVDLEEGPTILRQKHFNAFPLKDQPAEDDESNDEMKNKNIFYR
jgi:hypothetical protein